MGRHFAPRAGVFCNAIDLTPDGTQVIKDVADHCGAELFIAPRELRRQPTMRTSRVNSSSDAIMGGAVHELYHKHALHALPTT
jgi:hypothetical protein